MQYGKIARRAIIPILLGVTLATFVYETENTENNPPPTNTPIHEYRMALTPEATIEAYTATPSATPSPTLTPSPTATPTPSVSYDFLELQKTLEGKVKGYEESTGMNIALAVTDLQTRKTISVDGDEVHRTGCVINQFPVYLIAEEAQKGNLDPNEMDLYIRNSVDRSNPASTGVFLTHYFGSEAEGVRRVQDWMNRHGIEGTYNHVPLHGSENWTDNVITANETNEVLSKLYPGELFNPEWTDYVMDVLTYDYFYYGIPAGVDIDATVSHKIGYFWDSDGWVHGDTGIVIFPADGGREKAFAISIYTENGAAEFSIAPVAQDLTRTAYDYFKTKY